MSAPGSGVAVLGVKPRPHRWEWVARWCLIVTIAECVGFVAPAVVGAATANASWMVTLPLILVAGAIEGSLLGAGQAVVLHPVLPAFHPLRWVALTAAAAVIAYTVGMAPYTWAPGVFDAPLAVQILTVAAGAVVLLSSIGVMQWLELRRNLHGAAHWIWITAVSWLAALAAFLLVAMPLWQPGQPPWLTILIGVVAGAIMAAVQAFGTGWGMARLLRRVRGAL